MSCQKVFPIVWLHHMFHTWLGELWRYSLHLNERYCWFWRTWWTRTDSCLKFLIVDCLGFDFFQYFFITLLCLNLHIVVAFLWWSNGCFHHKSPFEFCWSLWKQSYFWCCRYQLDSQGRTNHIFTFLQSRLMWFLQLFLLDYVHMILYTSEPAFSWDISSLYI